MIYSPVYRNGKLKLPPRPYLPPASPTTRPHPPRTRREIFIEGRRRDGNGGGEEGGGEEEKTNSM